MGQRMGEQGRRRRVLTAVVLGCSATIAMASAFVPASAAVQTEAVATQLALAAPSVPDTPVTLPSGAQSVTVPPVTIPPTTAPAVTIPAGEPVTGPEITVPAVTLPAVTLPPATLPTLTVPNLPLDGVPVAPVAVPGTATSPAGPATAGGPLAEDDHGAATSVGAAAGGRAPSSGAAAAGTTSLSPAAARRTSAPAPALSLRLRRAVVETARQLSFPIGLALAIVVFLLVQHRLDRRDPRVVSSGIVADDELLGFS